MAANHSHVEERVIKLFEIENNHEIIFNVEKFQKLIQTSQLGNCEVCVIGILGKARGGKSFFLNIIRSYLKHLNKSNGKTDFFENFATLKDGFHWRSGEDPCTAGIDILNEILIFNTTDKRKIAIILVDCQGSHDNATTTQTDAKLFALCLLLCSISFYNIHRNFSEMYFQILEVFSKYCEMSIQQDPDQIPFQSLWFLIRDWEHSAIYGTGEGQSSLNKWLNGNEIAEKKKTRTILKRSYRDLKCAVLPHPGKQFTKLGKPEILDEDFIETIRNVIPEIFNETYLKGNVKQVDGRVLKLSDLPHYLEPLCKWFSSDKSLEISTMYQGTVEAAYNMSLKIAEQKYNELTKDLIDVKLQIPEQQLNELHQRAKQETLLLFKQGQRMKDVDMEKKYDQLLKNAIENRVNELRKMNQNRPSLEQIKNSYNNAITVALGYYDKLMKYPKKSYYRLDTFLIKKIHSEANRKVMRKFNDEANFPHEQMKKMSKDSLQKKINNSLAVINEINAKRKTKYEVINYYKSLVKKSIQLYNKEMKSVMESDYKIDDTTLQYKHLLVQKKIETEFKTETLDSYPDVDDKYLNQIVKETSLIFSNITVRNAEKPTVIESEQLKRKALENYLVFMESSSTSLYRLSEEDLEAEHNCAKGKALINLQEDFSTKPTMSEKMMETVKHNFLQRLNNEFEQIKRVNERKPFEEDVRKQFQDIVNNMQEQYTQRMSEELNVSNQIDPLELFHKHSIAKMIGLETFKMETLRFKDKSLIKAYKSQVGHEIEAKFEEIKKENSRKPWSFDFKNVFSFIIDVVHSPVVQQVFSKIFR